MPSKLYSYPQSNEELIKYLKLEPHPEGGHFTVSYVSEEKVQTPFTIAKEEKRTVQSTIYYLLSFGNDSPSSNANHKSAIGYLHKNKSETMHLHHCGRVIYTLISTNHTPPKIRQVVMGEDITKGEVRQLMVNKDEWKVSEIPIEDRDYAKNNRTNANFIGGLISEVVTPGFDWQDHEYMTIEKLKNLFGNDQESIDRFSKYVLSSPPF